MSINTLKPNLLWRQFGAMNAIPRASKHENALREYYINWVKAQNSSLNLSVKTDEIGNILISKPATTSYENSPKVILQGHIDMVCQKQAGSTHDFSKDPIQMQIKDGWVCALDTTLGADNGIGVAAALAILEDPDAKHGPLEILLTVDEEAGMGGVRGLQANWMNGDYLINLDSEEWGACYIGCAGGADIILTKELTFENELQCPHSQYKYFQLSLAGLKGGHSGLDIDTGRGNANDLLAEIMADLSMHIHTRLVSFNGGTLRNALTREALVCFAVKLDDADKISKHIQKWTDILTKRLLDVDNSPLLELSSISPKSSLNFEQSIQIFMLLNILPHGVISRSHQIDVVETSCNMGVIKIEDNKLENNLEINLLVRSLNDAGLNQVNLLVQNICNLNASFGINYKLSNPYPGWDPDLNSKALKVLTQTYHDKYKQDMQIKVIHAGLETGLIGKIYPHLQMVSFGPTITGAHSPDERVNIESVEKFYDLLKDVLARLN
ncbi:aminoacyl-histidine dipeptidase [Gammaproteobacteria bacterium]|nr:aminoacyl-histidine dipeptidase [Gammaproteobacteria bacterium]